jgi:hypothetical protein
MNRLSGRLFLISFFTLVIAGVFFIFNYSVLASEIVDTDGDGYSDEQEIANKYSPFNSQSVRADQSDVDQDGLNDWQEWHRRTNPFSADSDGDGYKDGEEVDNAFDPLSDSTEKLLRRIEINLKEQRLFYIVDEQIWKTFPVSTGQPSMPTPTGEFQIMNKIVKAWSNAYQLWMPYWLGLGSSRIGIHELPVWPNGYREGEDHLGQPVSHGCIRLGVGPASYLYERVDIGTEVRIKAE